MQSRTIHQESFLKLLQAFLAKLPDAIIAATELASELTLLTNNTKDFSTIPGLKVLDPHTL